MAEQDWVLEQLRTIKNLTDSCIHYRELGYSIDKGSILATLVEQLYKECQDLTDEQCVEK